MKAYVNVHITDKLTSFTNQFCLLLVLPPMKKVALSVFFFWKKKKFNKLPSHIHKLFYRRQCIVIPVVQPNLIQQYKTFSKHLGYLQLIGLFSWRGIPHTLNYFNFLKSKLPFLSCAPEISLNIQDLLSINFIDPR